VVTRQYSSASLASRAFSCNNLAINTANWHPAPGISGFHGARLRAGVDVHWESHVETRNKQSQSKQANKSKGTERATIRVPEPEPSPAVAAQRVSQRKSKRMSHL
jgi:hypothetical protein